MSLCFDGYKDFPHKNKITYPDGRAPRYSLPPYLNRPEFITMAEENLKKAAEIMEELYIPQFDKIVDIKSYLAWRLMSVEEKSVRVYSLISPRLLGCAAYLDGNFEFGNKYIDDQRTAYIAKKQKEWEEAEEENNSEEYRQEFFEMTGEWPAKFDYEKEMAKVIYDIDNRILKEYDIFREWSKNNDVSWVPEFIETENKKVLDLLKKRYSKLAKVL